MRKPDLLLEQYYLNEKKPDGDRNELPVAMDAIAKSNAEILAIYPAADMKRAVLAKLARGAEAGTDSVDSNEPDSANEPAPGEEKHGVIQGHFTGWKIASTALAACLVIAVGAGLVTTGIAGLYLPGKDSAAVAMSVTRLKGSGPELFIYKQDGEDAIRLETNAKVFPDDVIQLSYVAGSARYGAIISVDGNGVVTQHYPEYVSVAAMLLPRGETSLDFAYKLDDAPRFERFFFLTGNTAFSTEQFQKKLSEAARGAQGPDFAVPDVLKGKATITDIILLK